MAVALLWMVTLGGDEQTQSHEPLNSSNSQSTSTTSTTPTRQISCFLNGLLTILGRLLNGYSITLGRLFPCPFPHSTDSLLIDSS